MPSTYLPLREGDLDAWLANFADRIAADPAMYTLTTADAARISDAVAAWHAAYLAATAPETRTRLSVRGKNAAKRAALATVRRYAAIIRAVPEERLSTSLKSALGLHAGMREGERAVAIAAPEDRPRLAVVSIAPGTHTLRLTPGVSGGLGGKPRGAIGLMLYRTVSEAAPLHSEGAEFLTMATRSRYISAFTAADRGKTATYFGRWINAKGEVGPWSQGSSAPIAA